MSSLPFCINTSMENKAQVRYAIPCAFTDGGELDEDSLFFLTFNTRDEREAIDLARCVCGRKGSRAVVIITEHGQVFPL